jgi:hypothetical protein
LSRSILEVVQQDVAHPSAGCHALFRVSASHLNKIVMF